MVFRIRSLVRQRTLSTSLDVEAIDAYLWQNDDNTEITAATTNTSISQVSSRRVDDDDDDDDDGVSLFSAPEEDINNILIDFGALEEEEAHIRCLTQQSQQDHQSISHADLPSMAVLNISDDENDGNIANHDFNRKGATPGYYKNPKLSTLRHCYPPMKSCDNGPVSATEHERDNGISVDAGFERPPIGLYLFGDEEALTDYECLMRKQVEFFEPSHQHPPSHSSSRSPVGIRCRHCAHKSTKDARVHTIHPKWLAESSEQLTRHHIASTCPYVSPSLRDELQRLRNAAPLLLHREYWLEAAKECGIVTNSQDALFWAKPFVPNTFGRRKLHRQYYNFRLTGTPISPIPPPP